MEDTSSGQNAGTVGLCDSKDARWTEGSLNSWSLVRPRRESNEMPEDFAALIEDLKILKESEKAARKILDAARRNSEKMISDAEEEATRLLAKAETETRRLLEEVRKSSRKELEHERAKMRERHAKQVEKTQADAKRHRKKAVNHCLSWF